MILANIALQEREVDDDFAIFGMSDKKVVKCFVLSRELLQHLRNSIDKKLTEG